MSVSYPRDDRAERNWGYVEVDGLSYPRDDRAVRNRGYAEFPLSTVIPRVGNAHLQQNPILDSFSCTVPPKNYLLLYQK